MEVVARNLPAGIGSPVFDKLEAELAKACMSLPASKGFEVRLFKTETVLYPPLIVLLEFMICRLDQDLKALC